MKKSPLSKESYMKRVSELIILPHFTVRCIQEQCEEDFKLVMGYRISEYMKYIDDFVLQNPTNYDKFRHFLDENKLLFEDKYALMEEINNKTIDYVFSKVISSRIEAIMDIIGL